MSPAIRSFSIVTIALLFTACGSSPPVRYFTLQSPGTEYQQDSAMAPVLSLGPLRLPEYLHRSQLVSRGAGAEIIVDGQSRWAEPLDQAIHRTVARTVDGLVDEFIVIAYPTTAMIDPDYRLVGRIDRFEADAGGLAVLEIQWGVADSETNPVISARRSHYTKQADNPGDPGSIVDALGDTLAQFSQDIATELGNAFTPTDVE